MIVPDNNQYKKVKIVSLQILSAQIQVLSVPMNSTPLCAYSTKGVDSQVIVMDIMSSGEPLREDIRLDIISNEQETVIPDNAIYLNSFFHTVEQHMHRLHAFYTRGSKLIVVKDAKKLIIN
jgi:hypothetical protein